VVPRFFAWLHLQSSRAVDQAVEPDQGAELFNLLGELVVFPSFNRSGLSQWPRW